MREPIAIVDFRKLKEKSSIMQKPVSERKKKRKIFPN
jgi:hypothetical protein